MRCVASDVLEDAAYSVPVASAAASGVGWLRGSVARFSEGVAHRRRRALVVDVLDRLRLVADHAPRRGRCWPPSRLSVDLEADVAIVAAAYQPHFPQTPKADLAADRLVAACGGRTKRRPPSCACSCRLTGHPGVDRGPPRRIVRSPRALDPPCRAERRGGARGPDRRSFRSRAAPVPRRATRLAPC